MDIDIGRIRVDQDTTACCQTDQWIQGMEWAQPFLAFC